VATIDSQPDKVAASSPESRNDSAIVRQMVALIDAMSDEESESASAMHDIAECVQLLSQARLWPAGSTDATGRDSTPSAASEGVSPHFPEPKWGQTPAEGQPSEISLAGDRFEIRRMLGHGGFGVVLLAFDKRLQRDVALKVPRPEILASRDMRERFLREAQAAASLDHPNIVPVYDTGAIGPVWFITSRHVAGPTLAEWLRQQDSPIAAKEAAELVAVLAEAVHHAHTRGVLHRDLKPANVLLEPTGKQNDGRLPFAPRLSDFGLARRLDEAGQYSRHNSLVGTPRYMAPEQAACRHKDVGIQTDVYGLGVILYELLTETTPHVGDNDLETLRRIIEEPAAVIPLQERRAPRDLQTICLKALQKEPTQRYETASALAADLRRFLAGEPITARPVGRAERVARWCRRRPVQAGLCVALFLVSLVGIAGVTSQWIRAEHSLVLAQRESLRAEENLKKLELSFIDLAWVFEEAELWSDNDATFPPMLAAKLQRYADELLPQYADNEQAPLPILAAVYAMSAKALSHNNELEAAERRYRESIDLWVKVSQREPDSAEFSRAIGITLFGYANHLVKSGALTRDFQEAGFVRKLFATLRMPPADELRAMEQYYHMMGSVGYERLRRNQIPEALAAFEQARETLHELGQRSDEAKFKLNEASFLLTIAKRHFHNMRDLNRALEKTQRARQLLEQLATEKPDVKDHQMLLATSLRDEAFYTSRAGGPEQAVSLYKRSLDIRTAWFRKYPADADDRLQLGNVSLDLAQQLSERRQSAAALPYYLQTAENWEALLSSGKLPRESEARLAMVYCRIGEEQHRSGHIAEAISAFQRSIELADRDRKLSNSSRKSTTALIQSNTQLGEVLRQAGQLKEATHCFRRAVDLLNEQVANRPDNLNFKKQLETAQTKLAEVELAHSAPNE
jgi:tetratricopeptide (TPR) repeat protein